MAGNLRYFDESLANRSYFERLWMNRRQAIVGVIGIVLLGVNFLFPLTSYPVTIVEPKIVRNTHEKGFIPIWDTLHAQQQPPIQPQRLPKRVFWVNGPFGKPWGHPRIQWGAVSYISAGIVILTFILFNRLGRKKGEDRNLVEGLQQAESPKP
jgi:hypothetical protein